MARTAILFSIVTAALLAACVAWPALSVAEPISQSSEVAAPAGAAATTMPELTDALNKFRQRDYDGALALLKEAAKKNPELPPGYVLMAQLFSQANMAGAVRNALERAVMELPGDPEAYAIMGDIAIRERRVTEARLLYDKANGLTSAWSGNAKRKASLQPRIHSGLAMTDEAREDWTAAQKQLEAWLKLEPKNAAALQQLAQCLFREKNVEGAWPS
jgi:tetratricopeptide (TPR) repeat protein